MTMFDSLEALTSTTPPESTPNQTESPPPTPSTRIQRTTPKPTSHKLPPESYTLREVESMIAATGRGKTGVRNRTMIVVQFRCGIRCDEMLSLYPKDVDLKARTLRVMHGKGDKDRVIGMDDFTCMEISAWLAVRATLKFSAKQSKPLFCTLFGGKVDDSYVRQMLPRIGRRANIHKRVHSHGLRHSFACAAAKEGIPVPIISKALGHTNVATTQTYLERLSANDVVQAMRDRPWESGGDSGSGSGRGYRPAESEDDGYCGVG